MTTRRKLLFLGLCGLLAATIVALNHRPSRFPFLDKYPKLQRQNNGPFVHQLLQVDAQTVMRDAYQRLDSKDVVVLLKGGFTRPPVAIHNQLLISENLTPLGPDKNDVYTPGICLIYYQQEQTPLERGWAWFRRKLRFFWR